MHLKCGYLVKEDELRGYGKKSAEVVRKQTYIIVTYHSLKVFFAVFDWL